jgi:hypothetical protein
MKFFSSVVGFLLLFSGVLSGQDSLKGSPNALLEQNRVADKENLSRLESEREISRFVQLRLLVSIPNGSYGIRVDPRLERSRRYCRPWTIEFLKDLGTRFQKEFKKTLQVNSCVRDIETQEDLRDRNGNAAKTSGPRASSHLTGATVDISRLGLSRKEQEFIRGRLLIHERANRIEATEENQQKVWHIMVYQTYVQAFPKKKPSPRRLPRD